MNSTRKPQAGQRDYVNYPIIRQVYLPLKKQKIRPRYRALITEHRAGRVFEPNELETLQNKM